MMNNKFKIKDDVDSLIFKLYNIYSSIVYYSNFPVQNALNKNKIYRDKHSGEKCFILGTGPSLNSLTNDQIQVINKSVVFGVNSLYKSKIGNLVKPDYYALVDNLYWGDWSSAFDEVKNKYIDKKIIFITDYRAIRNNKFFWQKDQISIQLYAKLYPVNSIDEDISKNTYALMNVVSCAIIVAIFMGFKEINLLGCDYNAFCNAGHGHFYDDKIDLQESNYNLEFYLKHYLMITSFHYKIAELAKKRKVEILNLTPGSLLDAYPRIPINVI
jgi:hypothetical protein